MLTIGNGTRGKDYAERERRPRIPQAPLVRFPIGTAARWGEARQVTWADVDLERFRLILRPATTKNRRGRQLPLKPSLCQDLKGLLATHHAVFGRAPR